MLFPQVFDDAAVGCNDPGRVVGRSVVDHDHFAHGTRLGQHAVQGLANPACRVVDADDHGHRPAQIAWDHRLPYSFRTLPYSSACIWAIRSQRSAVRPRLSGFPAHLPEAVRIHCQRSDGARQRRHIVGRNEQPGLAVHHHLGQATDGRGNHGSAECVGCGDHAGLSRRGVRDHDQACPLHELGNVLIRNIAAHDINAGRDGPEQRSWQSAAPGQQQPPAGNILPNATEGRHQRFQALVWLKASEV